MKFLFRKIIPFFCLATLVFACTDLEQLEIGEYTAEYALPLFNSDISLQDLISNRIVNTSLSVDTDGQLTLNYTGSLLTRTASDIFDFTAAFLPIAVTDTVFHISNEDFDIPGSIDIDFLNLKKGQLTIQYESNIPDDLVVNVTIPQFIKDGVPYTNSFSNTYDGMPIRGGVVGDDLAGYEVNGKGDTLITVLYDAILSDGTSVVLPSFVMVLTNLEYDYAEGFLGNDVYDIGRDTIEIDFFDNIEQGIVNFEDPKIKFTAFNSFGFPLDASFVSLDVIGIGGEILTLESTSVENGVALGFPSLDQVGETVQTNFSFTKDNSNIKEILGVGPAAVEYELGGEPNPGTDPANSRGFMNDSSSIDVQLEVELPLNGYTFGFALKDTFDIDFSDYENVNNAEFKLITENGIPLGLDLEVSFTDDDFNVLDVLNSQDDNNYISAAPVDLDGFVNGVSEKIIIDSFDTSRFSNLKSATKILIRTSFNTTNSANTQLVRFNADQGVNSRMGLKIELAN